MDFKLRYFLSDKWARVKIKLFIQTNRIFIIIRVHYERFLINNIVTNNYWNIIKEMLSNGFTKIMIS